MRLMRWVAIGLWVSLLVCAGSSLAAMPRGSEINADGGAASGVAITEHVPAVLQLLLLSDVAVPDVVGLSQAAAVAALEAAGLQVTITEQYSTVVIAAVVSSQNPAAGTSVAAGSSVALVVSKGAVLVPDTGQTGDYTATWGEDADYTINPHSYTDLGTGIVRDNVTGLEWVQDGNLIASRNPDFDQDGTAGDGAVTWQHALEYVAQLNSDSYLGYSDWRLPTIRELSTFVDAGTWYPAIDATFFPATVASAMRVYWSSTTRVSHSDYALGVYFFNGSVGRVSKTDLHYVRAVRAGQPAPQNHLVDNGDGTVTDTATGLMWQQATAPGRYTWEEALVYCENLELAEYTDWRLPNRNELQSLVDYDHTEPAIDASFFRLQWRPITGRLLPTQAIQAGHGSWLSTTAAWATAVRLTTIMSAPCVQDSDRCFADLIIRLAGCARLRTIG